MKITLIVGVRPEFIQSTLVLKELKKWHETVLIHTGQHYDYEMNKIFFEDLEIPEPDYHLGVGSSMHGFQTGEMMKKIEEVLLEEKPDLTLVFGDTNSTIAGALATTKLHIKVGHVEAGMRSFDKSMPEEINRILTDHCSDLLFCSTRTAVENLKREGITNEVYLTGDVMVDSLLYNLEIAESKSKILHDLDLKSKEYLVVTSHRASNTDNKENLKNMVDAFLEVDKTIIFPMHPRTEKFLKEYGLYDKLKESVKLIKPLGYLDFLKLMNHAKKIITDSGGIQKEAYILKVPCITLRENTEWVETVEDGWNVLAGANKKRIIKMIKEFEPLSETHKDRFGSGNASREIVFRIDEV
jgi:UDP-N-acetylglucosamine 2-epimerase (non-hydrolysing)